MRMLFGLFLLLASSVTAQDPLLGCIRKNIDLIFADEALCSTMLTEFERNSPITNNILVGYHGATLIGMAGHIANPFKKMGYFHEGKELLETAIGKDARNIELRFLRLTIQTNLPRFIGYGGDRSTDKDFLIAHMQETGNAVFIKRVQDFIRDAEERGDL